MDLPEKRQVAALERVAKAGQKRARLLSEAEDALRELQEACIDAARAGASRTRVRELAGVSASTLYPWLNEAGVNMRPIRPKKAPREAPGQDSSP
jgi:hypothetical protein